MRLDTCYRAHDHDSIFVPRRSSGAARLAQVHQLAPSQSRDVPARLQWRSPQCAHQPGTVAKDKSSKQRAILQARHRCWHKVDMGDQNAAADVVQVLSIGLPYSHCSCGISKHALHVTMLHHRIRAADNLLRHQYDNGTIDFVTLRNGGLENRVEWGRRVRAGVHAWGLTPVDIPVGEWLPIFLDGVREIEVRLCGVEGKGWDATAFAIDKACVSHVALITKWLPPESIGKPLSRHWLPKQEPYRFLAIRGSEGLMMEAGADLHTVAADCVQPLRRVSVLSCVQDANLHKIFGNMPHKPC
jgi:hypothetical protein